MTTPPLLVVQTYFCTGPLGEWYEVHLYGEEVEHVRRSRRPERCPCLVFVTTDGAVYGDALDAEGTGQRFLAHWHRENPHSVLDGLEVV